MANPIYTDTWDPPSNVDFYEVVISDQQDCSNQVAFASTLAPASSFTINSNLPVGTYYVCVYAENFAGRRPASNQGFAFTRIPSPPQTLFVSFEQLFIDEFGDFPPFLPFFSSSMAGDWACTFYADNVGMFSGWNGNDLIYKAVISAPGQNAAAKISTSSPIVNKRGEQPAIDSLDFFDGTIDNNIYTEFNTVPLGNLVWTGSQANGLESVGQTCGAWNSFSGTGAIGNLSLHTGGQFIRSGTQGCTSGARLYCISPPGI